MLFALNRKLKTLINCVRKSNVYRKRYGFGSNRWRRPHVRKGEEELLFMSRSTGALTALVA